ncbi:hypothetical protein Salat_1271900 [Sesamum alatum]|uniref:Uncharacterized protein n=1 Tax=Sesamum alatum TaxID=300844 RepID=A0AAE1YGN6_9LAMI|nr:hypothetical protein Salat_1271900 [Sesamum alatum]
MPPSPAMRISPGRELRAENHKRGRSLESGVLFREKDDDLALFNEVQNKERDNFLLQSNDDFDDIFSTKLKYFSDYKLGISVPARGESSDLLNAEGDKNDYDWLITPPETPLFPTLDDVAPPVSLAPRGRPRSQPVSISRSSTMEKGYRTARGSASPHRLSPSPRSSNSTLQSRTRPFSTTHSSPPPTLRQSSPSRRLSPPPSKPTPAPRSGTPTPRRMSTGSASATAPSRVRGTSPVKTSRGNSASPKIKAWQSNIPGFSLEAPPNLRTSLADRPASYVRGSSPASRNGSRSGRQSMSPTASRSVSSSHSHERDQFSSYSKGSVASSGDDDVDSLQSNPVSSSGRSVPRSLGAFPNNRAMGFSKKPTKVLSSSAPKRSFDLALRQMERKGPQDMFRPLLSSVPSSTFYAGKTNAPHRPLTSRNSSITTSSNASSDQGTSGAIEPEESEQNQEDVTSDFVKGQYPTVDDEVFVMDQGDAANGAVEDRIIEESTSCQHREDENPSLVISQLGIDESSSPLDPGIVLDSADVVLDRKHYSSDVDDTPGMEVCSKCDRRLHSSELVMEGELWLCQECKSLEVNSTVTIPEKTLMVDRNTTGQILERGTFEILDKSASVPESLEATCSGETGTDHLDNISNQVQHSEPSKDLAILLIEEGELTHATQQDNNHSVDGERGHQESQQSGVCSNSKVDASEGTGISLLLKRSSSGRGHIVQSKSFTASNINYDDLSYVRDSVNSMRSSIGHSSTSVSSSVDLGSSRHMETRIHRQPSGGKSDMENYRYETPPKHKRSISSLSGASGHVPQVPSVVSSCLEDSFEIVATNKDNEVQGVTCAGGFEQSLASEWREGESTSTDVESNVIFKTATEPSSHLTNSCTGDASVMPNLMPEEPASDENGDNLTKNSSNSMNGETSAAHLETSTQKDDAVQSSCLDGEDVAEIPVSSSFGAISEMEIENADIMSADSQSDVYSTNSKSCMNELQEPSFSVAQDDAITTAISVPANGVLEESTIMLEDVGGTKSRSLTLEEATDAILFCSSIVHNLAYEAANLAIDKEDPPVEVLRPTMTFVGKSNPDRRDIRSRTLGKRSSKSQKARQRRQESDTKPPVVAETDEKSTPRIVRSPTKVDTVNPPKLESKCNCTIM